MEERIKLIMAAIFELPVDEIKEDASQDTIAKWDSVNHLNLVTALEEEFDISIPFEDVGVMTNYNLVKEIVQEQLNA